MASACNPSSARDWIDKARKKLDKGADPDSDLSIARRLIEGCRSGTLGRTNMPRNEPSDLAVYGWLAAIGGIAVLGLLSVFLPKKD